MSSPIHKVNLPQISTERFDEEVMIVNLEKGNYYSLTDTGAEIWELIEAGLSEDAIAERMLKRYAVDAGVINAAVADFASELKAEALIIVSDAAEADVADHLADDDPCHEKSEFVPPQLEKYTDMQELLLIDPIHEVSDEHGWPKMKP